MHFQGNSNPDEGNTDDKHSIVLDLLDNEYSADALYEEPLAVGRQFANPAWYPQNTDGVADAPSSHLNLTTNAVAMSRSTPGDGRFK
jgi:hypothetical protein